MSNEQQFDFYWQKIFNGLTWSPIEFSVYRFDESLSLPSKFNKLYEMFKQLALNNQQVMDYMKNFVETFDEKLYKTTSDVLSVWLEDGVLSDLIREAINEEVIEARQGVDGFEYINLKERLDIENTNLSTQVNKKKEKTSLKVYAHIPKTSGNSDCYIIRFHNGKTMMIDTASVPERYSVTNFIDGLNITKFDYCLITHAHRDHFGNLDYLINKYDFSSCKFFFQAPIDKTRMPITQVESYNECYQTFIDNNIDPIVPDNNSVLEIDGETTVRFLNTNVDFFEQYYGTTSEFMDEGVTSLNNFSVVCEITNQDTKFLFNGDIEKEAQKILTRFIGKQNFSTAPHHSSNRMNNNLFFDKVNPDLYYISCGVGQNFLDRIDYNMSKKKWIPTYISRYDTDRNNVLNEYSYFYSDGSNILTNSRTVLLRKTDTTITFETENDLINEINEMNIGETVLCMLTKDVFNFIGDISAFCSIEKSTTLYAKITILNRTLNKSEKNIFVGNFYDGSFSFSELPLSLYEGGKRINTNTDLNNINVRGVYYSESATVTNTLSNIPSDLTSGFRLCVKEIHTNERFVQELVPNFDGCFYMRNFTSQGWGRWYKYQGEIV